MEKESTKFIKSAEEFWSLMDGYLKDENDADGLLTDLKVTFDGWPLLFIKIEGDNFHSSLTSSMIAGMTSMNEAFQRAYAMAKYGVPNLQKLTNEDRQSLDVVFKIEDGSTESSADWSGTINNAINFLQSALDGMSGPEKVTVLLALISALTIGGCYYLNRKSKIKSEEIAANTQNTAVVVQGMKDSFTIASELKAKGETPASREIESFGDAAKTSILRSVANDANAAIVGGETYSGAQLLDFKNRQSIKRETQECFDNFYILGIQRSGVSPELNLLVSRTNNGESFNIKVSEDIARPEELTRLARAILTKEILRLSYLEVRENGHVARGQFNLIIDHQPPGAVSTPAI